MAFAVLLLSYYFFLRGDYSVIRLMEGRNKLERTKAEVEELENKIDEQKRQNELLKEQDPFEMEKKARERGMAREGETIYKYEVEKEN